MDYSLLERKREAVRSQIHRLSKEIIENYEREFAIRFTHNSTSIEGNTLTLMETKLLLEDGISVGGKRLREIYETVNHDRAFSYVKTCIAARKPLDEHIVKDIHAMVMENIEAGGFYRSTDVRITGAGHTPPYPNEMYKQIKEFYAHLPNRADLNPIELAAWTHAEFVRIHPFGDGNGRTSRLIMNYQLMANGFFPVDIPVERRLEYYEALDQFAVQRELTPFAELIAELELPALDFYLQAIEQAQAAVQEPEIGY